MEIKQEEHDKSITVHLSGKLNFKDHSNFNAMITDLKSKGKHVTLDLSELEMIDSAGIGMLFLAHKLVSKEGGTLSITNPKGQVKRVFDITSIDKHLKVIVGDRN